MTKFTLSIIWRLKQNVKLRGSVFKFSTLHVIQACRQCLPSRSSILELRTSRFQKQLHRITSRHQEEPEKTAQLCAQCIQLCILGEEWEELVSFQKASVQRELAVQCRHKLCSAPAVQVLDFREEQYSKTSLDIRTSSTLMSCQVLHWRTPSFVREWGARKALGAL